MKIILTQDVKNLGHKDDVVAVKDGYGRNYLIPKGMGKLATEGALKMLAEDIRQRAFKVDKLRKDAEQIAAKLNGATVIVKTKAGASGKIFGSVTGLQIANALKDQGYEVDINLFKDITAAVTVEVVAE